MQQKMKLNLGCGNSYLTGFVNADNNINIKELDLFCDLNIFPYPFKDNSVGEVFMDHVLEHLDNTIKVLLELNRICCNNAIITIKTPHFSCNWNHPGHRRAIGVGLFDHLDKHSYDCYGNCNFKIEYIRLRWIRPCYVNSLFKRVVDFFISSLANFNIRFCQRLWCYWVGGFEEIEFKVRVKK